MPSFESDWVRVTTPYPGATSEDVESLVTKPLEDELKSLQGIFKVRSTSSQGVSAIYITLASDYPNKKEVVQNIKDALSQATLPDDVDKPKIRQFKSSEKAIIDIGFYDDESEILTNGKRRKLQEQVLSFENQLLSLKEISSISKNGHILPELRVTIDPLKLKRFNISINEVINQIRAYSPKPSAWFTYKKERIKIISAIRDNKTGAPGTILSDKFELGCIDGCVAPLYLQREGKKIIHIDDFVRGFSFKIGNKLNE